MPGKERELGDGEIRLALQKRLAAHAAREPGTVLVEEMGLCRGQSRVDLAVVNGVMHGYEIKSDRDSLRRLASQIDYYSRVLDRVTIVVGAKHLERVLECVPSWWGVLSVRPSSVRAEFKTIRRPKKNPQRDPRSLVELLWLDDAMALLEERGETRGVRGKPRRYVWDRVCERVPIDEIAEAIRRSLKARKAPAGPLLPT